MNIKIDYTKFKIDSFTAQFPISDVIFKSNEINIKLYEVTDDGEILSTKRKPIIYQSPTGITYRCMIVDLFGTKYLNIIFTSKMLKENYLSGITLKSFKQVLEFEKSNIYYQNFKILTYENIKISDIDYCYDFRMNQPNFEYNLKQFNAIHGTKLYYEKTNNPLKPRKLNGITFNNRTQATIKEPFVKIYDKIHELQTRSINFFHSYKISSSSLFSSDLKRIEVTLKNSVHLKHYNVPNSIETLDYIPIEAIKIILKRITMTYNPTRKKPNIRSSDLTPSKRLIFNMLVTLINDTNLSLKQAFGFLDKFEEYHSSNSKSNQKKLLSELYPLALEHSKKHVKNVFFKDITVH